MSSFVISFDLHGTFVSNSSWEACVIVRKAVALNATVDGKKDAGDCIATFGEQCKKD